jgi:hypothetical protein
MGIIASPASYSAPQARDTPRTAKAIKTATRSGDFGRTRLIEPSLGPVGAIFGDRR